MLWHVIVNTAAAEAHVPRHAIIVIQDQTVATGVHLQEAVLHDILRVIEALRTGQEVHLEAQVVSAGQVLVVDHMAVVVHQEDEVAVEETKLISTSCFV